MSKIAIVTDTDASLPLSLADQHAISSGTHQHTFWGGEFP